MRCDRYETNENQIINNMKKSIITIIAMMLVFTSFAQEKKMLTPEDASYNNRSVYPVGIQQ